MYPEVKLSLNFIEISIYLDIYVMIV